MTGVPDAHVRITHLTGFGHNLELLEYRRPRGARRARGFHDVGSAHICLLTEDLDAECKRLCALIQLVRPWCPEQDAGLGSDA
jgi:hypothetical protein